MRGFPIERPLTRRERGEAEKDAEDRAHVIGICPKCLKKAYYREPWRCLDCKCRLERI